MSVSPPPPLSQDAASIGPVDNDTTGAPEKFDYDFLVIGGGSGGLAAAKKASSLGPEVAMCDFVNPSARGTKWGLGGTCVNVGCIPKKLMHFSGLIGEVLHDASCHYGWSLADDGSAKKNDDPMAVMSCPRYKCDWATLRANVDNHVRSQNHGYVAELMDKEVKYINAYASFIDRWTVETRDKNGETKRITARRFLVATGGRPTIPSDVEGAKEYGITSDDIFWWNEDPKRTLVVGASYVALECAGFLNAIGRDATVMIRSIPLRGFDQQMAAMIVKDMKDKGTKFIEGAVPKKLEKLESGAIRVTFQTNNAAEVSTAEFDTVLFATGRSPETQKIGLDKIGVAIDPRSGKIVADQWARTSVPNIYAIGDIVKDGLELTPVAIKCGNMLSARLFQRSMATYNFDLVPTTVFTPLEYGSCGLSEEAAEAKYGKDNIEVYHTYATQLESTVPYENTGFPHLESNRLYFKLVCNKKDDERVVGFHVLAPNAGEMTQGVAVAMKCGATKKHFDDTTGIHPTVAEDMCNLWVTKSSGLEAKKSGC